MGKALADVDPALALAFVEEHRHLARDSSADYRVFQAIGRSLLASQRRLSFRVWHPGSIRIRGY